MKNIFLLLSLSLTIIAFAQPSEGTIYYTESIKLDIQLPKGQEHLLDLIPTSSDQAKALYFTKDLSMYKDVSAEDDDMEINHEEGGNQMQIQIVNGSADNRLLKNFTNNTMIDQRDFLGKLFLIDDTLPEMTWKITGEQKKILDYTCMKATQTKDSSEIVAWFTPQIPLPNGPGTYGQLPGMILEMSMEGGKRTITATNIELSAFDASLLEKPKKGKKVTKEKFNKIQAEKLKAMNANGGGTVIQIEMDNRG